MWYIKQNSLSIGLYPVLIEELSRNGFLREEKVIFSKFLVEDEKRSVFFTESDFAFETLDELVVAIYRKVALPFLLDLNLETTRYTMEIVDNERISISFNELKYLVLFMDSFLEQRGVRNRSLDRLLASDKKEYFEVNAEGIGKYIGPFMNIDN